MAPLARLRLHELLKLPTGCTRGAARRLYLQEAKRCHPDAGGSEGAFIALHSAWREFSLAPPPPPAHEEIVTFVVRGDCTCGSTTAAASGCACCGGGDTGFWSAPRIEAVRQATWRAARAGGVLGRSAAAAATARPSRPAAAAGANGEPTAAAAAAATVPGTLPDVHECRARLIDPEVLRLEVVADDVSCTHGATVADLDGDALFYLLARGIPRAMARELLVRAFVAEVLGPSGELPPALGASVRARLEDYGAEAAGRESLGYVYSSV